MVKSDKVQQEEPSAVFSRASELLALKERSEGVRIRLTDVAIATGLNLHTVSRWMDPKPLAKIEVKSALALAEYFDVTFGDLFIQKPSVNEQ